MISEEEINQELEAMRQIIQLMIPLRFESRQRVVQNMSHFAKYNEKDKEQIKSEREKNLVLYKNKVKELEALLSENL